MAVAQAIRPRLPLRAESKLATAILVALAALAPLSIDMFIPSIPDITDEFGVASSTIRLAVTLYLITSAFSGLLFGPVSDRYGRRRVLVIGMTVYTLGGLLALLAGSAEVFVGARILQGFGGGVGMSIAWASVIDIYGRERATRILAIMSMALALAPMLAPIAGGIYQETVGWRWVFATLAAFGAILLIAYLRVLPETLPQPDPNALKLRQMLRNYKTLFTTRAFIVPVALISALFAGHLIFISTSAIVMIEEVGLSPALYGLAFGFVSAGLMAGGGISGWLVGKAAPGRTVLSGIYLSAAGSMVMLLLAVFAGGLSPMLLAAALIVGPMFISALGAAICYPAITAMALTPFRQMTGLAASVIIFSELVIASLYGIAYGASLEATAVTMTAAIALSGVIALVIVALFGRGVTR